MNNSNINRSLVVSTLKSGIHFHEELSTLVKTFGISLPQFNVLRILRGQKDKTTNLFIINERMIHRTSNTTRLIDKLINKDYVDRVVCEKNRRKIEVNITTEGLLLLGKIDPLINQKEAELMDSLTINEKEILKQILTKLT